MFCNAFPVQKGPGLQIQFLLMLSIAEHCSHLSIGCGLYQRPNYNLGEGWASLLLRTILNMDAPLIASGTQHWWLLPSYVGKSPLLYHRNQGCVYMAHMNTWMPCPHLCKHLIPLQSCSPVPQTHLCSPCTAHLLQRWPQFLPEYALDSGLNIIIYIYTHTL